MSTKACMSPRVCCPALLCNQLQMFAQPCYWPCTFMAKSLAPPQHMQVQPPASHPPCIRERSCQRPQTLMASAGAATSLTPPPHMQVQLPAASHLHGQCLYSCQPRSGPTKPLNGLNHPDLPQPHLPRATKTTKPSRPGQAAR